MTTSSLLLDCPIPRQAIELGRLVLDPKYPNLDFCQPPISSDVTLQRFENFTTIVERLQNTRIHLKILDILSITPSPPSRSTTTTITGPLSVTHQLQNTGDYFSQACREAHVRTWLEANSRGLYSHVYLVCGFKVLTDAQLETSRSSTIEVDASAGVPSALITAAAGLPLPVTLQSDTGLSAGFSVSRENHETVGYTAKGEHVYAVQYRKIKFSWFDSRNVEKAYLEPGNRWACFVGGRSGRDEDECIDVEVEDPISLPDLMGAYESIHVDGEEILYRPSDDINGVV